MERVAALGDASRKRPVDAPFKGVEAFRAAFQAQPDGGRTQPRGDARVACVMGLRIG